MKIVRDADGTFIAIRHHFAEKDIAKAAGFRFSGKTQQWTTADVKIAAKLAEYADPAIRPQLRDLNSREKNNLEASRATDSDRDIPAPAGLAYLAYQRAGIAYALERRATIIGDEMGLGKTIQAIGVINADPAIKRILVICPASLRINWMRELERWLVRRKTIGMAVGGDWPWPDPSVMIINYDVLKRHHDKLRETTWDLLIVDEAHYLKNEKAQRTVEVLGRKASKRKNKKTGKMDPVPAVKPIPARRRLYLTGTPIVNRPIELHPILKSIDPAEWGSYFKFGIEYCNGHQTRWGWNFNGASNLEELQRKLRTTCMIRRLKKDVLTELPAKRRQVIELPADGLQDTVKAEQDAWQAHQALVANLKAAAELAKASDNPDDYATAIERLREGARTSFAEISVIRRLTAIAKVPYVVEHARNVLEAGVDKLVIFAHHHDVIDALADAFGAEAVKLDGRDSMQDRDDAVQRFQHDPAIHYFVGSIRAAGVGLTLTASANVCFAELDWVPGHLSQAEDRCHRIGQQGSVLAQHLILEGSIDAQMALTIIDKQEVIDQALDREIPLENPTVMTPEKEAPATQKTDRRQIAKEAPKLTPEEVETVHAQLRRLADLCDGANARDGSGFNKTDTVIGKSLAAQLRLTPKQAVLGKRLTKKYHRQLEMEFA